MPGPDKRDYVDGAKLRAARCSPSSATGLGTTTPGAVLGAQMRSTAEYWAEATLSSSWRAAHWGALQSQRPCGRSTCDSISDELTPVEKVTPLRRLLPLGHHLTIGGGGDKVQEALSTTHPDGLKLLSFVRVVKRRRCLCPGSLMNRRLFQTQLSAYFSFRRMTRTDETADPRRWGPRWVAWAGKWTPSAVQREGDGLHALSGGVVPAFSRIASARL